MTRTTRVAVTLLAVLSLSVTVCSGCVSAGRRPFSVGATPPPEPSTTCPFGVRGARLTMSDTDDGLLIALRAYGDVVELRRRAHDAAAMYGPGAHRGLGHHGTHGGGEHHGLGLARLGVPVRAEAIDTPEGAKIVVRPVSSADLEAMREALWSRERNVRAGNCP